MNGMAKYYGSLANRERLNRNKSGRPVCSCCESKIYDDRLYCIDNVIYCKDCAKPSYEEDVVCCNCNEDDPYVDYYELNGNIYCADCLEWFEQFTSNFED